MNSRPTAVASRFAPTVTVVLRVVVPVALALVVVVVLLISPLTGAGST